MPVGSASIDFGAVPGSQTASVAVTGQTDIVTGSHVEAFFMSESTADHNADEHRLAARLVQLSCGAIVAGVGFTIYAETELRLTGTFAVRWVWA